MKDGSLAGRLAVVAGAMLRPLVQHHGFSQRATHRYREAIGQDYGSVEAYLEEQRRCAVYAVDQQVRERLFAA